MTAYRWLIDWQQEHLVSVLITKISALMKNMSYQIMEEGNYSSSYKNNKLTERRKRMVDTICLTHLGIHLSCFTIIYSRRKPNIVASIRQEVNGFFIIRLG